MHLFMHKKSHFKAFFSSIIKMRYYLISLLSLMLFPVYVYNRPSIIKACFSTAHVQSTVDGGSLLGSPMLDGALGQVASITNAMDVLFPPSLTTGITKSGKTDVSQFDSILPPEVPTSWVQCETCRKWRRVAWHVDGNTLPDLWDCSMNYWDSESASCDAPQDRFTIIFKNIIMLHFIISFIPSLLFKSVKEESSLYPSTVTYHIYEFFIVFHFSLSFHFLTFLTFPPLYFPFPNNLALHFFLHLSLKSLHDKTFCTCNLFHVLSLSHDQSCRPSMI